MVIHWDRFGDLEDITRLTGHLNIFLKKNAQEDLGIKGRLGKRLW
tara:strand:- start:3219 stop:3353 length:135 start_codon:yes stop_codon:yes gene_type:complete